MAAPVNEEAAVMELLKFACDHWFELTFLVFLIAIAARAGWDWSS